MGSIAYENIEISNVLREIPESSIDLKDENQRFINREAKLYLEAREIFDCFKNCYLDSNRGITAEEAETLKAKVIEIYKSI